MRWRFEGKVRSSYLVWNNTYCLCTKRCFHPSHHKVSSQKIFFCWGLTLIGNLHWSESGTQLDPAPPWNWNTGAGWPCSFVFYSMYLESTGCSCFCYRLLVFCSGESRHPCAMDDMIYIAFCMFDWKSHITETDIAPVESIEHIICGIYYYYWNIIMWFIIYR